MEKMNKKHEVYGSTKKNMAANFILDSQVFVCDPFSSVNTWGASTRAVLLVNTIGHVLTQKDFPASRILMGDIV
jgi:hypothetical protein